MQVGGIEDVARGVVSIGDKQLVLVGHQGQHMRTLDEAGSTPEMLPSLQVEDLDRGIDFGRNIQPVLIEIYGEMIEVAAGDLRKRYVLDQLKGFLTGCGIDADKHGQQGRGVNRDQAVWNLHASPDSCRNLESRTRIKFHGIPALARARMGRGLTRARSYRVMPRL